jgi:glucose/arabinose dehydrogenase
MHKTKPTAVLVALTVLACAPLAAQAQTAPAPTSPPPASRPETTPMPPAQRPAPLPNDKSASPVQTNPLIGLAVFSADGTKLGNVQSVATNPDGKATAIHLKTGGFLGIGAKLVAIPDGKFTKTGDRVQLSMTSDEVGKLPEYKENL